MSCYPSGAVRRDGRSAAGTAKARYSGTVQSAGVLAVVNPPGASGGVPLPVWIAAVVLILIVGLVLAVRRRR